MRNHWEKLLEKLDYKKGDKIVDIGGAMDPVPIADVVIDIVNLGKGGKSYCLLDLNTETLPFEDNEFDICICSQTLEDLCSPGLVLKEMQRIAKKGVIEVPHRGPESLKNTHYDGYPKPEGAMDEVWHFGTGHHKWLIEKIDGKLQFVPKIQFMLMRHYIPKWTGPGGVSVFWEDKIDYTIMYDVYERTMEQDYRSFRERNKEYWS